MIYSDLKDKLQKPYRIQNYDNLLLSTLCSMFVYKGFPKTVWTQFIEIYRLLYGACAFWQYKGDLIVSKVDFGGFPYVNGIGQTAICTTEDGTVKQFDDWYNNNNIVVMLNNDIFTPDLSIGIFSDMLSEVDTSLKTLLLYSRLSPLPVAEDEKQRKVIDETLNSIFNGKIKSILSTNALSQLLPDENGNRGIQTVNLTDVNNSDKIQYISKFRDDLFRWFYSLNGMNSQGSSKLAQQTVDEVNQDNNASMIIPHMRLITAQKAVKELNEKFELSVDVSLSECWMNRLSNSDQEFKTTDKELEENEKTSEEITEKETEVANET